MVYRDWNRWNDEGFTFLGIWCIYILGLFAAADAFLTTDVSALPWYSLLQMLFFRPMYLQLALLWTCRCFSVCLACINCIYILLFLGFKDTSFANFASTSHVFDNVRMLFIEILHPQPALSRPCGYSPIKMCILENPLSQISPPISFKLLFTSQLEPIYCLQKNWYKKFERIWSERWRHLERKFLC